MNMKRLLTLLTALFALPAHAAIVLVQQATPATVTGTSATVTLTGVTAGDTLLLWVEGSAAGTLSVTESLSETVNTAVAYAGQAPTYSSVGLYYVSNTAGGTVSFTANFGAGGTSGFIVLFESEYSGISTTSPLDAATAVTTSNTTSVSSTSITPAGSGELFVSGLAFSVNATMTWNAPYTSLQSNISSAHANLASALGPTGATAASGTASLAGHWAIAQAAFIPASGGGSCTHDGITSTGAIAIPNGTSGTYRLTSGALGTPDCSTVSYKQTQGAVGVN